MTPEPSTSDIQVVPHVTDELRARCGTGPDFGLVIPDGSRSACDWGSDPDAVVPGLRSGTSIVGRSARSW